MRGRWRGRRRLRRFLRPLRRRRRANWIPLAGGLLGQLREANRMREAGDPKSAARSFEELAGVAESQGHPQAAKLWLRAGRSWIEAGELDKGVELLKRGLRFLAAHASQERLQHVGGRVIQGLRSRGMEPQADEVATLLSEVGGARSLPVQPHHSRPELPAKCPQCGGSVHGNEVEWTAGGQAICDYCGTPLPPGE